MSTDEPASEISAPKSLVAHSSEKDSAVVLATKRVSNEAKRKPLSAFVIAFNESDQISECLESLSFCDEIIVVDSESTDNTREIASSMGAKVIIQPWLGYSKQKAFALTQTSHEWVLNIDADERVSEILRNDIERVISIEPDPNSTSVIGYEMNRLVFHLGRWWTRGGWYPEYRLRLFRRSQVTWGGQDPHEKPIPHGPVGRLQGDLYHFSYRNFTAQVRRLHEFAEISANQEFGRGKRASIAKIVANPTLRFMKFYFLKKGYREGVAGLVVAIVESYYTFLKYAKLWEITNFKEDVGSEQVRREAIRKRESEGIS